MRCRILLPALALLFLAAPARAALIVDVNRPTFSAALTSGSYTETFTTSVASTSPSASFSGGTPTFGYSLTVPSSLGPNAAIYRSGTFIGNNFDNEALNITPTTGNIHAIGGDFFLTNINNTFQSSVVTIRVADSLGSSVTVTLIPTSQTVGSFLGFRTNGFITSLQMLAPGINLYNSVDNLTVGQVPGGGTTNATPEPTSLAMVGIGLAGMALVARRKPRA